MRHTSLTLALTLASCSCPFAGGVQHPEMTPAKGSVAAPAEALGTMPTHTWSETTVDAAVTNKDGVKAPREGEITTLTGEVIDVSCYLQLGKHGAKHKECGQKCARNGNPIGLLTSDGAVWLLMAEEHHPRRDGKTDSLRDALIEQMANVIKVTGTATTLHGTKGLYVSGYAK